jgi:hypothetical protein
MFQTGKSDDWLTTIKYTICTMMDYVLAKYELIPSRGSLKAPATMANNIKGVDGKHSISSQIEWDQLSPKTAISDGHLLLSYHYITFYFYYKAILGEIWVFSIANNPIIHLSEILIKEYNELIAKTVGVFDSVHSHNKKYDSYRISYDSEIDRSRTHLIKTKT